MEGNPLRMKILCFWWKFKIEKRKEKSFLFISLSEKKAGENLKE